MPYFSQPCRRISVSGILLFFMCSFAAAQSSDSRQSAPLLYTPHPTTESAQPNVLQPHTLSQGTVHILAVMVEFEPADNRFTSGNGTFELDYLMRDDIIIDPLPHDQGYFEAHLEFARNYFRKASSEQLDLEYTVLPKVYRLSEEMKAYSPTGPDDSENFKLGNLTRDVWELVASDPELPDLSAFPQDRTMFIIFHAGAGRDLELTGTTLDNTPQDIPSVYLGQETIGRLADIPNFDGFELPGGLRVLNSAILPQTQSRRGEDVTGQEFVLELSINGILTANVGSFLGMPDLFNTETGASGIGQFGLMDGAGIFSYYGLFPPLPSAWERLYMGWSEAFDVSLDDTGPITLPAASLNEPNSLARHRISSDEYFLVENRHRDPFGEGVTLTIRRPDGTLETRTFSNEEERFSPNDQRDYDEILPPGVLVNVSNFDWSLPGGLDAAADEANDPGEDRELNGGMLIWHIDDAVIRRTIDDNAINANFDRRGVSLQEADGAQDIGRPAQGLTNFSNGGPFDFWWSGNDFTVITATGREIVLYENRFGDDTFPNNRSNTGSPTWFEFYDFSDNIAEATFRARHASTGDISQVYSRQLDAGPFRGSADTKTWPSTLTWHTGINNTDFLIIPGDENLLALRSVDESFSEDETYELPASDVPVYSGGFIAGARQAGSDIQVTSSSWDGNTFNTFWESTVEGTAGGMLSTTDVTTIDLDTTPFRFSFSDGTPQLIAGGFQQSAGLGGVQAFIEDDVLTTTDGIERSLRNLPESNRTYAAMLQLRANSLPLPFLITDTELRIIRQHPQDDSGIVQADGFSWPAVIDFNDDGSLDFIYVNYETNRLEGKNDNGAFLWDFPLDAPDGITFTGAPLIADITGNERPDILVAAADSLSYIIHGYDYRLNPLDGFPLYVGSLDDTPDAVPVQPLFRENRLYAVSPAGDLKVWEFDRAGRVWAGYMYGSEVNNKIVGRPPESDVAERGFDLLNKDETYNWPNPARDETWIRYQTGEPADITITVASMSGTRLYERRVQSAGGSAEEVLVDTSSWSSGVYYARVRASNGGTEETRLIKIAVIR